MCSRISVSQRIHAETLRVDTDCCAPPAVKRIAGPTDPDVANSLFPSRTLGVTSMWGWGLDAQRPLCILMPSRRLNIWLNLIGTRNRGIASKGTRCIHPRRCRLEYVRAYRGSKLMLEATRPHSNAPVPKVWVEYCNP